MMHRITRQLSRSKWCQQA